EASGTPASEPNFDTGSDPDAGMPEEDSAIDFSGYRSRSRDYESQGGVYRTGCHTLPIGQPQQGWWLIVWVALGVWLRRRL
ncbi:MAG: hypothetical protein AAFS10_23765, partial [Myxococcota bacterium]